MSRTLFRLFFILTALLPAGLLAMNEEEAFARLVRRVESCEAILRETMDDPRTAIPYEYLSKAKGIVIVNQFQAGVIIGAKGGYAVVLVRRTDTGSWSLPCFLEAGEASFGLQLGAKAVETIYLLMDDSAVQLLYTPRFNFGVDARAAAGPHAAGEETGTEILNASVLVYTSTRGLYAGATIKSGYLAPDAAANRRFYHTEYSIPELLYGKVARTPPVVNPLIDYLNQIAR